MKKFNMLLFFIVAMIPAFGQLPDKEQITFYTAEWEGERDEYGRPIVEDELLDRLKNVSIEEAWGVLRGQGYHNQYTGDWEILHEDQTFVGRALTALYYPLRPEIQKRMEEMGHNNGMIGAMNSWPIDMLKEGDVYVADCFGKVVDGTLIGDNLGNAIYAKSKTGVVFDAGSRDMEGLSEIEGFNAFVRGWDPSYLTETMLMGINTPIRIGEVAVFPGDAVLAKKAGVIFIPAHLVQKVVINAEFVMLRDMFGHQRLKEGKYTPGQIDGRWSDKIKQDFLKWLDENPEVIPMSREELDEYMENRTW